jgi:hypothetical protein
LPPVIRSALLTALLAIALQSCDQLPGKDRYEIKQDSSGRTIRLDKQTGEISILEGDKLTPIQEEADKKATEQRRVAAEAATQSKLQALALPTMRLSKPFEMIGVKATAMDTMRTDGKLYFQLQLHPAPKPSAQSWGTWTEPVPHSVLRSRWLQRRGRADPIRKHGEVHRQWRQTGRPRC